MLSLVICYVDLSTAKVEIPIELKQHSFLAGNKSTFKLSSFRAPKVDKKACGGELSELISHHQVILILTSSKLMERLCF